MAVSHDAEYAWMFKKKTETVYHRAHDLLLPSQTQHLAEAALIMKTDCMKDTGAKSCNRKTCNNKGQCQRIPYTQEIFCSCDYGYEGDLCEKKTTYVCHALFISHYYHLIFTM